MSNSYSEKAHPSSIYSRLNTCYVIPLFSYTDTLFEWSQMKIMELEFPIFWNETFCFVQNKFLLLNFCLCVYFIRKSIWLDVQLHRKSLRLEMSRKFLFLKNHYRLTLLTFKIGGSLFIAVTFRFSTQFLDKTLNDSENNVS